MIVVALSLATLECSSLHSTSSSFDTPFEEQYVIGTISRLNDSLLAQIRPDTIAVVPRYPNPFGPPWTVDFHVLKQDSVMISFYDKDGRSIRNSFQEFLLPGVYRFNPTDLHLNAGVYFIRCQVGDKYFIRKSLLMR